MNYLELLNHSYNMEGSRKVSRLDYLSENIFNFTTYDSDIGSLFAKKAIEVCNAINNQQTFEYQKDPENYKWYILMVNMPFFTDKLEWASSIRGAWWNLRGNSAFKISSCGLWEQEDQLLELTLNAEQWDLFIKAVSDFANT
jgi:hypothetical protein